jgi:o-succinylbenzoate synthase
LTVDTATVYAYEAPLEETYETATARHDVRRGLVLALETDGDVEGLGEAAPLSNRTESLDEAREALVEAGDALEGCELDDALDDVDDLVPDGTPTARFAVEEALIDAEAREDDRPLVRHLARRRDGGVAEAVPVNATVPARDAQATEEAARRAVRRGFDTVKLKGVGDAEADRERVARARAGAGSAALRLDVNGAWPDVDAARERLEELEPYGLEYVEQPLPPDDLAGLAKVRRDAEVPVAADEPITSVDAAREVLETEAADVLVLKPMVLGGLRRTLEAADLAADHGADVVVTSTIDGAVGRAGALHAAAALGTRERACGLATGDLFEAEPLAYDERFEHGRLLVPDTAGHGAWRAEPLEEI